MAQLVHELERRLRVSEPVIKFITVRMDEEQKRLDKIKAIRATRKKLSAQPAASGRCSGRSCCPRLKLRPRLAEQRGRSGEAPRFELKNYAAMNGWLPQYEGKETQWLTKQQLIALPKAERHPHPAPAPRRSPYRRPGPGGPGGRKFFRRKKVCKFCTEKIDAIPYRDVRLLQGFVAERGKIVPRRLTGVCTTHQRRLTPRHQAGSQHRPAAVCGALLTRDQWISNSGRRAATSRLCAADDKIWRFAWKSF